MSDHKVYRNPPIAMVAVEVRHSGTDPVSEAGFTDIRRRLRERWPVQLPAQDLEIGLSSAGPSPTFIDYQRFLSRDRRTAIAIRPTSTTVETVDYRGWEDLQETLSAAFDVRAEISEPSGFERVGLRYIDEVRVRAGADGSIDWSVWVHPSLLGARSDDVIDLPVSEWQGLSKFGPTNGQSLVVRYGPRDGYAVEPNGALKRATTPVGPFFLLDFDSFWEASASVPEFDPGVLMTKCDDLHAPVRKLFEGLITDTLREEVLDADSL